ncbi:MAG: peptidoglycan-binding protein [Notoacmeibacter sp.]|nr:peptidoglycan-binding protein [Notoacmeibacter sp.]
MPDFDLRLVPWTGGHEGFVSRWYRDPVGVPTIGFGFTWSSRVFREYWVKKHGRKFRSGDTISKGDALRLLTLLIAEEYAPPVLDRLSAATPHATAAAIDMSYNCGPRALKWKWFAALARGEITKSASLYRVTARTARGRRLPGLVRRRREGATILEFNRWPAWVKTPPDLGSVPAIERAMPDWWIGDDDFGQGLDWLVQLGFLDRNRWRDRNDPHIKAAVLTFQRQHKQLDNDGVLGRATLDQLQRVIDLKRKAARTGAGGGGTAAAGGADTTVDATGYGDLLLWGGLAVLVIAGGWLAWRYRDELKLALASLARKGKRA